MQRLEGKVAIVTASAGAGIGQATVRRLAQEGAKVVVSDIHERRTAEVAEDLKAKGFEAIGVPCNVTDKEQVEALVKQTLEAFGRIDTLVNNAARNIVKPVVELDDESWDTVVNVNLKGTFYCSRAVLPTMIKQRGGNIVNISSIAAWIGSKEDGAAYCAAKAGIMAFTKVLAREAAPYNIRVNCIAPGFIPNPFLRRIYPEEVLRRYEELSPMGRGGKPEEVANVIAFLVSDEASYITGETVCVSGGTYMH